MKKVGIIGGGFSGALTAVQLLKKSSEPVEITLLECGAAEIGRGVAYNTYHDLHLLNVPAAKMSCLPDQPDHLMDYLREKGHKISATDFIPRKLYGEYVNDTFKKAVDECAGKHHVNVIRKEASDVVLENDTVKISLADGSTVVCHKVVLALGNFEPADPKVESSDYTSAAGYIKNPFVKRAIESIAKTKTVLIIGTGLTAVDILMTLNGQHHEGDIIVISNHGYLPAPHKLGQSYPDFFPEINNLRHSVELMKNIRQHIRNAAKLGVDYRAVIDAIRPHTQQIWYTLSTLEKKRFLAHLRHLWGVARHRMPDDNAKILGDMLSSKKIKLKAGRLKSIIHRNNQFEIRYTARKKNKTEELTADYIVNCTGPESDYEKVRFQLTTNLLRSGLIIKDDISYGIRATAEGKVIDSKGEISGKLYTIGPPMKGILWECTAVPEIRVQAQLLATQLLTN